MFSFTPPLLHACVYSRLHLSLCLSLSLSHTHTHTFFLLLSFYLSHIKTHKHTHTHCSLYQRNHLPGKHAHTAKEYCQKSYLCVFLNNILKTLGDTHTHTLTHTHTHTHTQTHTHTYKLSLGTQNFKFFIPLYINSNNTLIIVCINPTLA